MKRVLVAALSARHRPYDMLLDCSLRTWNQRKVDGVDSFFYTGLPDSPKIPEVISFPIDEGLFTMGRRNLEAFKWALANKEFDYLARVNASCYVRKQRLLEFVQDLPDVGACVGLLSKSGPGGRPFIWGGGQYIFSRDIVQLMAGNANKWNHSVMEDVAMSWLLIDAGVSVIAGRACSIDKKGEGWICHTYGCAHTPFEMRHISEFKNEDDQFFIRVKQDGNRYGDVKLMHQLFELGI